MCTWCNINAFAKSRNRLFQGCNDAETRLVITSLEIILPIAFAPGYVTLCVLPPLPVAFYAAAYHSHCSITIATHHTEGDFKFAQTECTLHYGLVKVFDKVLGILLLIVAAHCHSGSACSL